MTHDVEVPITQKVVFPAFCVVCEKPNPDNEVELSFLEAGFSASETMSTAVTGSTYHVENPSRTFDNVPVCKGCAAQLKSHHLRLKIINYTFWALSVALAIFLPASLLWKAVAFLVFFLLPILIGFINPPAIDVTISKNIANFQFKSHKFAEEFKKLNTQ